jgi:UDP-N-acetylglucosamine--N-acetylmuramyl-(pentapeptide) pyrophosphoryl-undecaprenol N-acetylglucosamine transferase
MRFLLAGGGTGGHLFPGLALADALRQLDPASEILFVGTRQGLDEKLVPAHGYRLQLIAAGRGSPLSWRKPLNLPRFAWSVAQSVKLLRKFKPDALVALGGFAAAAPGIAARLLGVPLAVLELNTVPGRVSLLLSRWAMQVHSHFAEAEKYFDLKDGVFRHSGYPLRKEFAQMATLPPADGDCLLIVGGSQGASELNRRVLDAAPMIAKTVGNKIIHIAGEANEEAVRDAYKSIGIGAEVIGFCDDMPMICRRCRLAISRSGAGGIAELAAAGLPAILVPLPTAKDDHQTVNARAIENSGGAVLLPQAEAAPERLSRVIAELWGNAEKRKITGMALRKNVRPDACKTIASEIMRMAT